MPNTFFPWHNNYLPPNIPSACSSMCSKSRAPKEKEPKKSNLKGQSHGGLLALRKGPLFLVQPTGHVVGSFNCSAYGHLTLGVALVKLSLENGKQAGNPVVQTHVQDELKEEEDRTGQGRTKVWDHGLNAVLEATCWISMKEIIQIYFGFT